MPDSGPPSCPGCEATTCMAAGIGRPLGPLGPKPQVCGAEKGAAGPSPRGLTNVPSWLQAQQVCGPQVTCYGLRQERPITPCPTSQARSTRTGLGSSPLPPTSAPRALSRKPGASLGNSRLSQARSKDSPSSHRCHAQSLRPVLGAERGPASQTAHVCTHLSMSNAWLAR